jgi:hypothetical protein
MNVGVQMNPTEDDLTSDPFMEDPICDQLAEPVDISIILLEMGKAHLRESVDADLQNWC